MREIIYLRSSLALKTVAWCNFICYLLVVAALLILPLRYLAYVSGLPEVNISSSHYRYSMLFLRIFILVCFVAGRSISAIICFLLLTFLDVVFYGLSDGLTLGEYDAIGIVTVSFCCAYILWAAVEQHQAHPSITAAAMLATSMWLYL